MSCPIVKSGVRNFTEYLRLNNRWAFKESETVRSLAGKQYSLTDTNFEEVSHVVGTWRTVVDQIRAEDKALIKQNLEPTKFKEFQSQMKSAIKGIQDADTALFNKTVLSNNDDAFRFTFLQKPQGEMATVFKGGMKEEGVIEKLFSNADGTIDEIRAMEFTQGLRSALRLFTENGYDMQALFKTLNHGDFVENLLSITQGHFKVGIAEAVGKTIKGDTYSVGEGMKTLTKDFKELLRNKFIQEGVGFTEKQLEVLVDDMLGKSIVSASMKKANRFVMELRGLYNLAQLTFGANGWLFLAQSCLIGKPHQIARQLSSENLGDSKLGKYLFEELNFLNSEKVYEVEKTVLDGYGDTFTYRGIGWLSNKLLSGMDRFNPSLRGEIETVIRGGVHNAWDIAIAARAKRDAVGQALGAYDITPQNADQFLKDIRDGKVSQDTIIKLRADANTFFADFRTASDTLALSRNRFSKYFFLNIRASYLINRAGDFLYGFQKTAKAIQDGHIRSFGDFMAHMDTNEELRTVLINTLLSAKIAAYVDRFYEDESPEDDKADRIVGYWNGLNDYYAALTAALPIRLVMGPIKDTQQYVRFMDAYGEEVTTSGTVHAATYGFMNQLVRTFFKEAQILDPMFEAGKAAFAGQDMEIILETMDTHMDRIRNSAGRFGLMEGLEPYGLKKFPQPDDYFNSLLMAVTESNPSVQRYQELRNVENMEKLMESPEFAWSNLFKNINSFPKWLIKDWSESETFDRIRDTLTETDPIMKDLWNGKWNPNILRGETMRNGKVVKGNVDNLFKELQALNLPSMGLGPDGLKAANEFGLNIAKKEAFETELVRIIDKDSLVKAVTTWNDIGEDRTAGLVELMAYADAKVPGSSRLMLSYLADKAYSNLNQSYARDVIKMPDNKWEYEFTDKLVPDDIKEMNKRMVLNKFYPSMYVADKTSWYRLAQERMETLYPGVVKISPENKSFLSAVGMLDLIAYGEAKSGNPDANFIKNVFTFTGKYVDDPARRLFLGNRAMDSIDATASHPDVKAAAKLGFVAGNIDIVDKMLNDPEMVSRHGKELENAMNKIFGTLKEINNTGSDLVRADISDAASKHYSKSTGKPYYPSRYSPSNSKVKSGVDQMIPSIIQRMPSGYTPSNVSSYDHSPWARFEAFAPKYGTAANQSSEWYAQVYARALGKAETQALVTGYVNRFPGDTEKDDKFRLTAKAPRFPNQKPQRFSPKRARYAFKTSPFEG